MFPSQRLLVGVAIGPGSDAALAGRLVDDSITLASLLGASVTFLYVEPPILPVGLGAAYPPVTYEKAIEEVNATNHVAATNALASFVERARLKGIEASPDVVDGRDGVAEAICAYAGDAHFDLIVVSSRGRRGLAHVFLGSVAERVARLAPVPVLLFRGSTGARSPWVSARKTP